MSDRTTQGEPLSLLRLSSIRGLGARGIRALVRRFGSAGLVFQAGFDELCRVDGVDAELARAIQSSSPVDAESTRERMAQLGVRLLLESDAEYPPGLREIADPPLLLSMRGELQPGDRVAVAIVGTRRATAYGRRMAERLAGDLALRGITVVSGLARGIDGVAHEAALAANGRTIAVLASGLQRIYPPEHHELAERIVQSGALLTEAPLDGPPLGQLFPKRNRIISGMSLGVVVVEAGVKSGALSTAMHALHQNREVFAVPGRVGDGGSEGTHLLLRQGAALVTSVQDIVDQLGPIELPASPVDPRLAIDPPASVSLTSPVEHRILAELGDDPIALEELLEKANVSAAEASAAILVMETKRLVRRLPGNRYARARS